jgi:hypothetical protein
MPLALPAVLLPKILRLDTEIIVLQAEPSPLLISACRIHDRFVYRVSLESQGFRYQGSKRCVVVDHQNAPVGSGHRYEPVRLIQACIVPTFGVHTAQWRNSTSR